MNEKLNGEMHIISPERERLFQKAEKELYFPAKIYRLGERFERLGPELSGIIMLDVTEIPGCHYGAKNVFVPILHHLEERGTSPESAILVEPSTGNGWVAFSDAAEMLGYEHAVIMPDGLPEARYKHPKGRKVNIIRTPKEKYAVGMPEKLRELIVQNKKRHTEGKKIYVSPNHSVGNGDITVNAMSDLGRQLVKNINDSNKPIKTIVSMGNGASLCAIGEYVKNHSNNAKVVATEDFAYGGGYDHFAKIKGLMSYRQLFGINFGTKELLDEFSTFGTNVPIGVELPLQARAIDGDLIDDYVLFADDAVLNAYEGLLPEEEQLNIALKLPNRSNLPKALFETYGNSTLANIVVASNFTCKGENVVAMAYDGRKNY